jgi:hypothetical protein
VISRVGVVVSVVLLAGVVGTGSAARQPPTGTAIYVVRDDPRLCPSPRCGGYWVALANGARTRCTDGLRHPRCYVARTTSRLGRPLDRIPDGALVRGALADGREDLAELRAHALYAPAGTSRRAGGFYRVVDTGIRCVRAPCFSYAATQVNGRTGTTLSEVDLTLAQASAAETARAQRALRTKDGLYAQGLFVLRPAGGRGFVALRLFLRAPLPRA